MNFTQVYKYKCNMVNIILLWWILFLSVNCKVDFTAPYQLKQKNKHYKFNRNNLKKPSNFLMGFKTWTTDIKRNGLVHYMYYRIFQRSHKVRRECLFIYIGCNVHVQNGFVLVVYVFTAYFELGKKCHVHIKKVIVLTKYFYKIDEIVITYFGFL